MWFGSSGSTARYVAPRSAPTWPGVVRSAGAVVVRQLPWCVPHDLLAASEPAGLNAAAAMTADTTAQRTRRSPMRAIVEPYRDRDRPADGHDLASLTRQ